MTKQPTSLGAFSVSLAVKDLSASRAFYEKLGFETSLWAEEMARNHTKKRAKPLTIKMHRDVFKGL